MSQSKRSCLSFYVVSLLISACNIFSGDTVEYNFDASIEGSFWRGPSTSQFSDGSLIIQGKREIAGNTSYESISMRIAEFNEEDTYKTHNVSYTKIIGGDGVDFFGHSVDTTDTAIRYEFDKSLDIIDGEFQFDLPADKDFNSIESGDSFTIRGEFSTEIDRLDYLLITTAININSSISKL